MFTYIVRLLLILFFLVELSLVSYSHENADEGVIIKEFKIIGNKTTREHIILRELPFKINDTIAPKNLDLILQKTKENLLNTSLFNFVTVQPVYFDKNNISVYITVEERWYWWPVPIFDLEQTNFNTWWLDKDFDYVNYGLYLTKENFRGSKETVSVLFQGGYTEKVGIRYIIPYINRRKTNGLNLRFTYSRNHEVTFATTDNVRDFYRTEIDYAKKQIGANIGYELRPKLYNKHNFNLKFTRVDVADSVVFYNDDFLIQDKNKMKFFSFNYTAKRDRRNNKNYPTLGYYYDISLYKDGLGILDNDLNSLYFTSQIKKFWQLSDRFYYAESIKAKFTIKEGPYYLYNGLGFGNNLVRGYEFYVLNGEHYGLFKSQLRYSLLKNKIFKIDAIRAKKFNKIPLAIYMGAYFDAGFVNSKVNSENNFLVNTTLFGGGMSIDFVSYYDLVFRIEYSINKLNETGLFFHFVAPI